MSETLAILPNEATLVARSVVEITAFAKIYDHYFSRVYNYLLYRVQDADTADDITALVFERALTNIHRYRPEKAPFGAWLFAIARNAVNDHFRQQRRRRWLSLDAVRRVVDPDPDPIEIVAVDEVRDKLLVAVSRLSDRERDLVALKFAAGLTNRRIAEVAGLSESNVAVILFRTMKKLRARLEAQGVSR